MTKPDKRVIINTESETKHKGKGENTMKNINEIHKIIRNMSDELFDRINKAEDDYWSIDKKQSRNGYKRMVYNLNKVNLTVDEWFEWCAM